MAGLLGLIMLLEPFATFYFNNATPTICNEPKEYFYEEIISFNSYIYVIA